jgi:2-polyprenyl-3-methyl-5-hydroxy-6-metoxy-1,4-benzoquinol methylase
VISPQRLSDATGARISHVGEWLGIHWLIYNPLTFRNFHRVALHSAPGVTRTFRTLFPSARRYLDVGAGSGAYAADLTRGGFECLACEHSAGARRMARKQGVDCRPFDLTKDPPTDVDGPFDVAYSFEVAEHVPEPIGQKLVEFIASQAPHVVFTAAPPGQIGMGHINCQPQRYWIEQFARCGMTHRADLTELAATAFKSEGVVWWLINNVMVFERR